MPVHDFTNPITGETTPIYVAADAPTHQHQVQIINGQIFKREWGAPHLAISTARGDCTADDFRRVTQGKNLTVGDMYDVSREMSEARAATNGGVDPVKQAGYERFERENGYEHPDIGKRKQREKLREMTGIIIED